MSSGRPAALDGSLLARKGDAVPAIPDESPLVLHLDDHRRDPDKPELVSAKPETDAAPQEASVGLAARVMNILSVASGRIKSIPSRIRWTAGIFLAVLIVIALWQSASPNRDIQVQAAQTPEIVPVANNEKAGLQLNLVPTASTPEMVAATSVSPEAAEGGNIALVKEGDTILIDIPKRIIRVKLSQAELKKRRVKMSAKGDKAWKPIKNPPFNENG